MTSHEGSRTQVDVVIPCWGAYQGYLERCLSSVVGASRIIVVGDADLEEACRRLGAEFVSRDGATTPGEARGIGLAIATSPYVAFLDVDDEYLEGGLQTLCELLDGHPQSVAVTAQLAGTKPGHTWPPRRVAAIACSRFGGPLLLFRNCYAVVGACVMRREAVNSSLFPTLLDEDWHAAVRLVRIGQVNYVKRDVVRYDVRVGSVSRQYRSSADVALSHNALLHTALSSRPGRSLLWRLLEPTARAWRGRQDRRQQAT